MIKEILTHSLFQVTETDKVTATVGKKASNTVMPAVAAVFTNTQFTDGTDIFFHRFVLALFAETERRKKRGNLRFFASHLGGHSSP